LLEKYNSTCDRCSIFSNNILSPINYDEFKSKLSSTTEKYIIKELHMTFILNEITEENSDFIINRIIINSLITDSTNLKRIKQKFSVNFVFSNYDIQNPTFKSGLPGYLINKPVLFKENRDATQVLVGIQIQGANPIDGKCLNQNNDIVNVNDPFILFKVDTIYTCKLEDVNMNSEINVYKIFSNITQSKYQTYLKKVIIENIFDISLNFLRLNPKEVEQLLNSEKESKNLITILTLEKKLEIRKLTLDFIKKLISELGPKNNEDYEINIQILLLQYYYPYLISEEIYFEQFYELYNYLINIKQVESNVINIQEIISKIFEYLYKFYIDNKNNDLELDKIKNKIKYNFYILSCFSPLYDDLIKKEIDSKMEENKNIISILYDCLFSIQKFDENNIN
jgi:hypothetical protein